MKDFDVNNPEGLEAFAPDIDPDAPPELIRPAPPDDGVHWVLAKPNTKREGGYVYYKDILRNRDGIVVDGKVVAALSVRMLNDEGNEGAYLKDYYPSSTPRGPKKGSALTFILSQAKRPIPARSTLPVIKTHTEEVLAEISDEGIRLLVETRWVMSKPQTIDLNDGMGSQYVYENGNKVYSEVKGQDKIVALAIAQAESEVLHWPPDEDESAGEFEARKQLHIDTAPGRAHLWVDPVSGEERSCSAEIFSLEDPRLYPDE